MADSTGTTLAEHAAARAKELGWSNQHVLDGGTAAWAANGGELYSGVNVPSKAFGEFVEHTYGTPRVTADDLNCAGRTRSIIGSQSLINAGLENRVVALENGTMGWELAGLEVAHGHDTHAPDPGAAGVEWAQTAVRGVAERFGVRRIKIDELEQW